MKNKSYRELIVYTTFGYIFDVKMFFYARNGTFEIRFDESRSSVYFDLRFRLRSYVCQGHPTTVSCNICWEEQTLPRLFYYFSLRCRRLEVVGKRENGRARGRHACLLLARPFFLVPTQFQAPATQATITCGGLQMCWWPFHSCSIFEAYVIYSIWFSKV